MNAYEAVQQARARQAAPDDAPSNPLACRAHGCPCVGGLDIGITGRFYCPWHAWALPGDWPRITDELLAHEWLLAFIREVTIIHDRGKPGDWEAKATEFFRTDKRCQPQPQPLERGRFNVYRWRLREELAYRVGVRKDRPVARPMQTSEPGFARALPLDLQEAA